MGFRTILTYVLPIIQLVHQTNQQRGAHDRHNQRHHNSDDERNHLMFSVSVRHSSDNVVYSIIRILPNILVLLCSQGLPTFGQSAQAGSVGALKQHHSAGCSTASCVTRRSASSMSCTQSIWEAHPAADAPSAMAPARASKEASDVLPTVSNASTSPSTAYRPMQHANPFHPDQAQAWHPTPQYGTVGSQHPPSNATIRQAPPSWNRDWH